MQDYRDNKAHQPEKMQEIPKWTSKYAESRMIPFLLFQVVFILLFAAIGLPSYFGGMAYRSGNMFLFWVCMFCLAVALVALVFFSVPKWGGKWMERVAQRFYAREGNVTVSAPERMKKYPWVGWIAAILFGSSILASVILGRYGYIPHEYMQPVSAVYTVPFLIFLLFWTRPSFSFWYLVWPFLYALHAILIVAGAPIRFTGPWDSLNMLIPTVGYGTLCGLIGHVGNRFALRKLRRLAKIDAATGAANVEINQ